MANTGLLGLTGYRGRITISNPGTEEVTGWSVTLSLPSGQRVDTAAGAEYRQRDSVVTFTPSGQTATVGPGGEVSFTFDVSGLLAGPPTGCAIDGRSCG
jgi:hypothetical protein